MHTQNNTPRWAAGLLTCLLLFNFASLVAQESTTVSWRQAQRQSDDWYGSPEAIRIADNLLVYQHATGGWPKNLDMAAELSDDEISAVRSAKTDPDDELGRPTIDNRATHTQLRYLAKVLDRTGEDRFRESFLRGVDYLLEAQYGNGGWPQFYPLRKGYYSHITYNDGAMIGVLEVLHSVARGEYDFVDQDRRKAAGEAVDRGVDVILRTQITVDGQLTAWCAQYDAESLEPAKARAYELVSLSGSESVGIVEFLMELDAPSPGVVRAVRAAIDWFERVQLRGLRLVRTPVPDEPGEYDVMIAFDPTSDRSLWARFYEIGTNYPIFVGRDGVVRYTLAEVEYERRVGYSWIGDYARELLEEDYPAWEAKR